MRRVLGRPVAAQRGWEYLRSLDRTPQRPRPRHADADAAAQAAFKQTSPAGSDGARGGSGRPVEAWTMDEHRLGLKPILRRVWARRGHRPVVAVRPRYQWLWVYAFVRPATGETWWLILPRVNVAAMGRHWRSSHRR